MDGSTRTAVVLAPVCRETAPITPACSAAQPGAKHPPIQRRRGAWLTMSRPDRHDRPPKIRRTTRMLVDTAMTRDSINYIHSSEALWTFP
jgi:hypothetical protein